MENNNACTIGGGKLNATKPQGVFSALSNQQDRLARLQDVLGVLGGRLSPVMSPSQERDAPMQRRIGNTEVENLILMNTETIDGLIEGVESFLDRLEI